MCYNLLFCRAPPRTHAPPPNALFDGDLNHCSGHVAADGAAYRLSLLTLGCTYLSCSCSGLLVRNQATVLHLLFSSGLHLLSRAHDFVSLRWIRLRQEIRQLHDEARQEDDGAEGPQ